MMRRIITLFTMTALIAPMLAHAVGPKAYVGEFKDNAITVLDTAANKVLKTIPVPAGPHGVAITPDGRRVYVSSDGSNTVSVIDTEDDQVVQTIEVGKAPHGLVLTPDGRKLLVAVFGANQVVAIDTVSNRIIGQAPVPSPHNIAIQPGKMVAYVASQAPGKNALVQIDVNRMSLAGSIPLNKTPRALNFSPDGKLLYFTQAGVDAVRVFDTDSDRISGEIAVGASPHHVVFAPSGTPALTVSQGPGTLVGIDPLRNEVLYTIPAGKQPHWIALTPNARTAYVTNEGSNTVSVVDLGSQRVAATIPVGNGPRKIAIQASDKGGLQKTSAASVLLPVGAQQTGMVGIKGFAFTPAQVAIAAGQPATWVNQDSVTHTVTAANGDWTSGDLAPGSRFRHVFVQSGTYDYACSIHPYMQGRVVVR